MGGLVLAGAAVGAYFLFKGDSKKGLSGLFTIGDITDTDSLRKQYYKLSKKYHPDVEGGSKETFQELNNEYEKLFKKLMNGSTLTEEQKQTEIELDQALRQAADALAGLPGITIELAGKWLWVSGNTYPIRNELKAAKFLFAPKKKMWFFKGAESGGRGNMSYEEIKIKYNAKPIMPKQTPSLKGLGSVESKKLKSALEKIKKCLDKRKA
jgi:hypothetical protein